MAWSLPVYSRGIYYVSGEKPISLADMWFLHFSSVVQSCLTLCDPINHSMPGLPVHHQLPESTQTHVH